MQNKYYIYIENNKIKGSGQALIMNEEINNLEVSQDEFNLYTQNLDKYIYNDGEIIENPNYEQEQALKAKQQRIDEIKAQLTELDQKRIRALCEPSTLTNESNQTWLEYYNNQVLQLREELQSLLREQ